MDSSTQMVKNEATGNDHVDDEVDVFLSNVIDHCTAAQKLQRFAFQRLKATAKVAAASELCISTVTLPPVGVATEESEQPLGRKLVSALPPAEPDAAMSPTQATNTAQSHLLGSRPATTRPTNTRSLRMVPTTSAEDFVGAVAWTYDASAKLAQASPLAKRAAACGSASDTTADFPGRDFRADGGRYAARYNMGSAPGSAKSEQDQRLSSWGKQLEQIGWTGLGGGLSSTAPAAPAAAKELPLAPQSPKEPLSIPAPFKQQQFNPTAPKEQSQIRSPASLASRRSKIQWNKAPAPLGGTLDGVFDGSPRLSHANTVATAPSVFLDPPPPFPPRQVEHAKAALPTASPPIGRRNTLGAAVSVRAGTAAASPPTNTMAGAAFGGGSAFGASMAAAAAAAASHPTNTSADPAVDTPALVSVFARALGRSSERGPRKGRQP